MDNDLRAPCIHGRYERHPLPGAEPTAWLGLAGMAYKDDDWCPGGRKIQGQWWDGPNATIELASYQSAFVVTDKQHYDATTGGV